MLKYRARLRFAGCLRLDHLGEVKLAVGGSAVRSDHQRFRQIRPKAIICGARCRFGRFAVLASLIQLIYAFPERS
ncbi:hypothetical protein WN72_09475 [Bradyrhizobium arachidis]|uniref:Uncharacterized protein n=1 Tax=Bradyrhizobium arachidis TaxID=858423 RepID=A0AAE7TFU5_9BRAD|nr:hypothetical protein WN72_09475 [Bradyrhizobium arachidis]